MSPATPAAQPHPGSATVNTAQPVVTLATNQTVAGVAFNSQTDKAILLDPTSSTAAILNALDQTSSSLTSPFAVGNAAAAFNSLANIAVIVNNFTNQAAVIDPTTPTTLGTFATGNNPVDVAIDPGTNTAVVVNQNASGTVSVVSLGTVRQYHVFGGRCLRPDRLQHQLWPPARRGGLNLSLSSWRAWQSDTQPGNPQNCRHGIFIRCAGGTPRRGSTHHQLRK